MVKSDPNEKVGTGGNIKANGVKIINLQKMYTNIHMRFVYGMHDFSTYKATVFCVNFILKKV